jgi:hypothetical protein
LEFLNILFHRVLYLIGSEIFETDINDILKEIERCYEQSYRLQKEKVDKCVVFIEKLAWWINRKNSDWSALFDFVLYYN